MITTNAAGKTVDTSTNLSMSEFWNENSFKATISKRTFYKRIESGKFNSFESAITTEANGKSSTAPIKSVTELNESAEENFFDTFMSSNDEDEMEFGSQKIKAPVGA